MNRDKILTDLCLIYGYEKTDYAEVLDLIRNIGVDERSRSALLYLAKEIDRNASV